MNAQTTTRRFEAQAQRGELLERCERTCAAGLKAGADEVEVFASHTEKIVVQFEKDDLKLTQVDEGGLLGVRVFKDRSLGFCATNQMQPQDLEGTARDAVELAGFNPRDEANLLARPAANTERAAVNLAQGELADREVSEVVALGRSLFEDVRRRDPRLSVDQATVRLVRGSSAIHTSAGVRAAESDAVFACSIFGMAVDGDDVGGFQIAGDCLRELTRVEERMTAVAEEFAENALGNLGATAAESYVGPVLFSPSALLDVFVSPLIGAASAIAVQRGRSALAGKLGERVATEQLSVYDDPTLPELSGACSFDREGVPTQRRALVERGLLESYLYNGYAAAVEQRSSTGHAQGGARSIPDLGPHAILVAPGNATREELLRSLGRGLYVQRFSGTVDPTSGDFSGVAKSARWIEDGRAVRSVKETLMSGNAFELLQGDLCLSSVSESVFGAARAPHALVDGISVTAG